MLRFALFSPPDEGPPLFKDHLCVNRRVVSQEGDYCSCSGSGNSNSNSSASVSGGSGNWASEASPTLGCSIEISCGMSIGMYVCRGPKSVGGNTWAKRAHAQGQYWAVKSDQ